MKSHEMKLKSPTDLRSEMFVNNKIIYEIKSLQSKHSIRFYQRHITDLESGKCSKLNISPAK